MLFILSDDVLFAVQHVVLVGMALYGALQDFLEKYRRGIGIKVIRGDKSLVNFWNTLGFSIVIVTLINQCATQAEGRWYSDYTVALNAVDIAALSYFCLLCRWGRNRILGFSHLVVKLEEK
jgi:hypothetical protein